MTIDKREAELEAKADKACSRYLADLFDTRKENAFWNAQKRLKDYRAARELRLKELEQVLAKHNPEIFP